MLCLSDSIRHDDPDVQQHLPPLPRPLFRRHPRRLSPLRPLLRLLAGHGRHARWRHRPTERRHRLRTTRHIAAANQGGGLGVVCQRSRR